MSGVPTEAEVRTQWVNAIDILESLRSHADSTQAGAGGKFDTLLQSLEGEYTPQDLSAAVAATRAQLSATIDQTAAQRYLLPIIFEYGNILSASATGGYGAASNSQAELFAALYDWFVDNSITIASRSITYDTSVTAGGSNVGNGALSRLTEDENGYDLEACHVEKKIFRCIQDQNSGVEQYSESFVMLGEASSQDGLLRANYGSGNAGRNTLRNHHSGSSNGGSLLTNSSFTDYDSTTTPKFNGWTESAGGANIAQDTTTTYIGDPSTASTSNASLRINGGSGTVTLKQPLTSMRQRRLDPTKPYFLRVMLNKTAGTAVGGTVTIRMGSTSKSITIAALGTNWQELAIDFDQNCWFNSFNEDPMDIEIEWSSSTSGYLLVDAVIFAEWAQIDGTWWMLRDNAGTPTSWAVDDSLTITDTGGAAGTGKLQYWNWVAGLGYLPTSGTPTIADP